VAHKYAESRKRARLVWSRSEHGKAWSKNYMREYRKRPEVKKRAHEYYINKKIEQNNYSRPEKNYQINFDDFCKGEDEKTVSNDKETTSKKDKCHLIN